MESLTGACIGALTVYDMLKPIDDTLSLGSIRLLRRRAALRTFTNMAIKR